jgi:hypothetical protein
MAMGATFPERAEAEDAPGFIAALQRMGSLSVEGLMTPIFTALFPDHQIIYGQSSNILAQKRIPIDSEISASYNSPGMKNAL